MGKPRICYIVATIHVETTAKAVEIRMESTQVPTGTPSDEESSITLASASNSNLDPWNFNITLKINGWKMVFV